MRFRRTYDLTRDPCIIEGTVDGVFVSLQLPWHALSACQGDLVTLNDRGKRTTRYVLRRVVETTEPGSFERHVFARAEFAGFREDRPLGWEPPVPFWRRALNALCKAVGR